MQDEFAHCAELVRARDRDRYVSALFAASDRRNGLFALYAFNSEITRVREVARETLPGEIRLQWWRDVVSGERSGEATANPVAAALLATIKRGGLTIDLLTGLIEAHRFDLYNEPMARLADLESYACETESALINLAAQILTGASVEATARPAGIACGITNVLRRLPYDAERGQVFVPAEMLSDRGNNPQDVLAGRPSAGLDATLKELRDIARRHLVETRQLVRSLPPEALAAFLPVVLVRPWLDRLEREDPFSPPDISPWRRQWLIWRAARNPARIAA